jgi:uncharacterized membrane protein
MGASFSPSANNIDIAYSNFGSGLASIFGRVSLRWSQPAAIPMEMIQMIALPAVPAWNAMHPLVVHFPIALLLVAPLFVVLGAVLGGQKGRPFLITALLLMAVGTAGIFVARESGEAASKAVPTTAQIEAVLDNHEELAETTSILFLLLTGVFAAMVVVPMWMKRPAARVMTTALPLAFLLLYSVGALFLVRTAHDGGRLVHELGVRSPIAQQAQSASNISTMPRDED